MASNGGKLRLAHDLQHAGMRHANTLRDGAKTHALGVRRTNGNAPSLFGLGTFAGKTAKVSGGHLRDEQLGTDEQFVGFPHSSLILQRHGLIDKTIGDRERVVAGEALDVLGGACVQRPVGRAVGIHAVRIENGARYVK